MENLIRKIRVAAGMNQADFGRAIGRSMQSVHNYELGMVHGLKPETIDKIKNVAVQAGRSDLAIALTSEDFTVQRVFHPGETIITAPPRPEKKVGSSDREEWHAALDEILDSGDKESIDLAIGNLEVFRDLIRLKRPASLGQRRTSGDARKRGVR